MPAEPWLTTTRSPSVAGEAEQKGLVGWVDSFSSYITSFCHRSLPSARAKQRRERLRATAGPPLPPRGGQRVLSPAWVTKTRSPQTAGLDVPSAGRGAFQRTFSFGPQRR